MTIEVTYYSWFKDIAKINKETFNLNADAPTLGTLLDAVHKKHPVLKDSERSTLMAVGLDYQKADYQLKEGDEVSFFPPVQGG